MLHFKAINAIITSFPFIHIYICMGAPTNVFLVCLIIFSQTI